MFRLVLFKSTSSPVIYLRKCRPSHYLREKNWGRGCSLNASNILVPSVFILLNQRSGTRLISLNNTCTCKCVQNKKFVWWLIFFASPIILSELCYSPSLPVNLTKHLLYGTCMWNFCRSGWYVNIQGRRHDRPIVGLNPHKRQICESEI